MDEKIIKWGLIAIFGLLFIGGFIYFMFFLCCLLSKIEGFTAIIVIVFAIFLVSSSIAILKRMF